MAPCWWDRAVFYKPTTDGIFQPMEPEDIMAIRTAIDARRSTKRPYDVVTGGPTPGKDPAAARAKLAPLAEAGLTVWHESLPNDPRAMGGASRRVLPRGNRDGGTDAGCGI